MNNWSGLGRAVRDADIRYTAGDNSMCVARYTLAVDRRYKKEGQPSADFISCVALGKNAEWAEKYLRKGIKIAVTGHIQTGSYTNKDGNKVYTTDVMVDHQEFAESKAAPRQDTDREQPKPAVPTPNEFMDLPEDADDDYPPFK